MPIPPGVEQVAQSLGFSAPVDVAGRRSIAAWFPSARRRTGVYLLAFGEGCYYIGLARDVVRRFAQHRRTYGEQIAAVAFRPARLRDLEVIERELIRRAERAGVPLEQTEWKSEVYGGSDLDDVLPAAEFARWRENPSAFFAADPLGAPPGDAGRRSRDARCLARLLSLPTGPGVVGFLARFARECVPGARRTTHDFWSVACLPSTNAATWPRLACLSAHVMEVLVIGHAKGAPESTWGFVVCARTPLEAAYGGLDLAREALGADAVEPASYRSAGHDQCRVRFSTVAQAQAILDQEPAREAAGLLLYRVMRKGVTRYANYDCTELATCMLTSSRGAA